MPEKFIEAARARIDEDGPTGRMSPYYLQLLNCCLAEKMKLCDGKDERVFQWRRKMLEELMRATYLKVCANVSALLDHEVSILSTHSPHSELPLEPIAINPLRFLLIRVLREFGRNCAHINNEE